MVNDTFVARQVLDGTGTIQLHNQQGVQLVFGFEGMDVTGNTYVFRAENGLVKNLVQGAASDQKVLEILTEEFEDSILDIVKYSVTDETDYLHELILEGQIRVRGF